MANQGTRAAAQWSANILIAPRGPLERGTISCVRWNHFAGHPVRRREPRNLARDSESSLARTNEN